MNRPAHQAVWSLTCAGCIATMARISGGSVGKGYAVVAIATLLIIVSLSLAVNRIATVALMFTGLSKDAARFQSRSAFTGAGFTTSESELIVQHPVRRRIIMVLMFLGNAGLITVIATLMSGLVSLDSSNVRPAAPVPIPATVTGESESMDTAENPAQEINEVVFGTTQTQRIVTRVLVLVLGLLFLWIIAISKWVDAQMFKVISWALVNFTSLESHDYHGILHLSEGFSVTELEVGSEHWVTGNNLAGLRLSAEGIQVLGVLRADKTYVGSPTGHTYIRNGDKMILYGQGEQVNELKYRVAGEEGDSAHEQRVNEYRTEYGDEQEDDRTDTRP